MSAYQETFAFNGTSIVPASELAVYGVEGDDAPNYNALGFTRVDRFLSEDLCEVWKGKDDTYLIDICLDGSDVRTVRIDGFPMLLEFIRHYLEPIVTLQSSGFRKDLPERAKKIA